MKALLSLIISGALVVSGYSQTRNVLVGTNNAVVQPTNFWSADASNARTGLGLGTASTNPSSAFQPASSVLSNLVSGASYPTFQISNISGLQASLDSKLSITGNAVNLTNFPASLLRTTGDASGLTNFPTLNQNTTGTASNVTGVVAIANGGTGTNSTIGARQNLGLVWTGLTNTNADTFRVGLGATTVGSSLFTLANPSAIRFLRLNADNTVSALSDSDFRTAVGLGTAATNPASAFQPASSSLTNLAENNGASLTNIPLAGVVGALATNGSAAGLTNFPASLLVTNGNGAGLTNLTAANIMGTVGLASNVTGTIAISNGGSGATTAGGARTNFGLVLTALTNTNADTFRAGIGLGGTDSVEFLDVTAEELKAGTNVVVSLINQELTDNGVAVLGWSTNGIDFFGSGVKAATRTNLGLGASWLTNTNNPVFVNTNGEVVSPTNFWQEAPITTTFIESQPTTNSSTNISPSRLLHIHSLATNIVNTTNTIVLPTNTLTFEGDMAMVVHKGPTNSLTQVRQAGSTNNLITLNKFNEAVEFTYYNNNWQFLETVAFTAPIYFSGTNAAVNAAASRTNLGLGTTNTVNFARLELTDTTTNANLWISDQGEIEGDGDLFIGAGAVIFKSPIEFNNTTNAAATRTNLGIPLAALTNTSNANFRTAIELGATNNVTFNDVTASGTLTATSTVTAKTNLVVDGFVDYTAARTNNTPTNTPNFAAHAAWIEVKIGTNSFFLPAYQ